MTEAKKVVEEIKAEAKKAEAEVKAEVKKAAPVVKKVEAEVEAEAEMVTEVVRNFVWADFEGVACPTSDGSIPGYHSLMWHAPDTPQEVLNELGKIFL